MIERLCKACDKPVSGKLFKDMCRPCYDKRRQFIFLSVAEDIKKDFQEYAGERKDRARCVNELLRVAFRSIKHGKRYLLIPQE